MKALLCSIPATFSQRQERGASQTTPKIAIVSLLRWMEKFGYSGDFYDIDMLHPSADEIFNHFKHKQLDVVGLSAIISGSYLQVKTISNIIRRACPSTWIVLGGNMAASANVLLRKTDVDVCFFGDGEKSWVEFLNYVKINETNKDVKELSKIKGIAFINDQDEMEFTGYGEPIPGNKNSFPDYELLSRGLISRPDLADNYFRESKEYLLFKYDPRTYEPHRKPKVAIIWTTKGCVNRCTFCQRFCKGYRLFDLEKLDHHIVDLKEKYDVQFIQITDESFGSNKKHAYETAKIMKKHDILWFCGGVRCTSFTLEDLKFLKQYGCVGLTFGVESGSQKILDIMEKRFTMDDTYAALMNANECGLLAPPSFCIGVPGETDQTIMETGQFLGKIARMLGIPPNDLVCPIFYALPLPGSPLYEYGQLQGVIGSSVDEEEAYLIHISGKGTEKSNFVNLTGMSTKTVLFWDFLIHYEAMRTFYRNPVKKQKQNGKNSSGGKSSLPFAKRVARIFWKPITSLNEILICSPLVAKIPSPMVYILMRNFLYAEYKTQIFLRNILKIFGSEGRKIAQHLEFHHKIKKCKPLTEVQSLRKINKRIREKLPVPQTLSEKNQQIFRLGR